VEKHGSEVDFMTGISQGFSQLWRKRIYLSAEIKLMGHHDQFDIVIFEKLNCFLSCGAGCRSDDKFLDTGITQPSFDELEGGLGILRFPVFELDYPALHGSAPWRSAFVQRLVRWSQAVTMEAISWCHTATRQFFAVP
jgi:hypothetical protein